MVGTYAELEFAELEFYDSAIELCCCLRYIHVDVEGFGGSIARSIINICIANRTHDRRSAGLRFAYHVTLFILVKYAACSQPLILLAHHFIHCLRCFPLPVLPTSVTMFFSGRIQDEEEFEQLQQPLLPPGREEPPLRLSKRKKWVTVTILALVLFIVDLGYYFTVTPLLEIVQDIICRKYHPSEATPGDGICKSDDVQKELALVWGWFDTLTILPGALLTIPAGILADRWGRKPALLLALFGFCLGETWMRIVCKSKILNLIP